MKLEQDQSITMSSLFLKDRDNVFITEIKQAFKDLIGLRFMDIKANAQVTVKSFNSTKVVRNSQTGFQGQEYDYLKVAFRLTDSPSTGLMSVIQKGPLRLNGSVLVRGAQSI